MKRIVWALLLGGCGSVESSPTPTRQTLTPSDPPAQIVSRQVDAGPECFDGGVTFQVGVDLNDNGVLDDDEVTTDYTYCVEDAGPTTTVLQGNVVITNTMDLARIRRFTEITGELEIRYIEPDLPNLQKVRTLTISNTPGTTIRLPSLTDATGLTFRSNEARSIELPALQKTQVLELTNNRSLNNVYMPSVVEKILSLAVNENVVLETMPGEYGSCNVQNSAPVLRDNLKCDSFW